MKLTYTSGESVVALRQRLGLNQSDFWNQLGVTQSGGSRYESGRRIPEPVQLLLEIVHGPSSSELLAQLRGAKR